MLRFVRLIKRGGVIVNEHTLTATETRRHVEVLARWFDFIHLDDLPRRLSEPRKRPFCLLTFDDGKRSNAAEVAPELARLGVPAVFYLSTEALTNREPLWFDRQRALVRALGRCPVGLELETLKQLPFRAVNARLRGVCSQVAINSQMESDDVLPMSWEDARSLARQGFTIGAHGRTHAILTCETWEDACAEIELSLREVTSELGAPCRTFAFPNGNYTTALAQHAVSCGATTIMTTEPSWITRESLLSRLPRIQLFGEFSRSRIELKIALAALRGVLANPDGTGRAYWRTPPTAAFVRSDTRREVRTYDF